MGIIIGASGRARHGKTVFCEAVAAHVTKHKQSAKLYDIGDMIRLLAIERGLLFPGTERATMGAAELQILIDLGKEMRKARENFWVEQVLERIDHDKVDVALCPNLRLPMEAQAFRDAGGYIVRCKRLNKDGSLYISPDRPPNDITETALEFWPADYYLTTIDGVNGEEFMARLAVTTYEYIRGKHGN